jgi:hypothetical protein
VSASHAQVAGADEFWPVEQCWHLADLERDGYAVQIVSTILSHGHLRRTSR